MQSQGTVAFITKVTRPFTFFIVLMIIVEVIWALLMNTQPYIVKLILNNAMDPLQTHLFAVLAPLMALYVACEVSMFWYAGHCMIGFFLIFGLH